MWADYGPLAPDRGQPEQLATGRADLELGVHARADAAVEARRPAAVVLLVLRQRVLPVGPEPVLVQPGVQVVPGQHLGLAAFPGGVPVEVDPGVFAGLYPPLVREVLRPAVEAPAQLPDPADHRTDTPVPARQQPFDQRRLPVVVPVPDRAAERALRVDRLLEQPQPVVDRFR